ncbi:ATPase, histidine kinase-, DNA gyrase B-, and HSP90-like domain protein [Polymorphum gilvum SL003B-26A1]|uniref:histidine kinase n=2 Tax=Polymorphum TaxID=991903 RepID=F2IV94_POLGS|nr:ATPase, histidine kinase-, DNA gyrase B-, and HSP90-like domain protein [Polymorphum gilvum SL003B-26A1]
MPRSLGAQLIALLLIALIGTQAIALWLFAGERRTAIFEVVGDAVIVRAASLVPLLETATDDVREQMLRATSSPVTRFWIAPSPAVREPGRSAPERRLGEVLLDELGTERDIRVAVSSKGRMLPALIHAQRRDRSERADEEERGERKLRDKERPERSARIAIDFSVALADGSWLNVTTSHRPPPPGAIQTLLLQIVLMALAIVAIVAFTIRRLTRPLRRLAAAADRLGRGEDMPPLAEEGPQEVRSAIRAFNEMQDRLTRFVRDRTRMLAAISHDLRTPITSLRIRAEFIDDDEDREKMIAILDEMAQMTEATLAFARDEATQEERRSVDLGGLMESIAGDQSDLGRDVEVAARDRVVLACRPVALKRALRNLVENAVRYGTRARIAVRAEGGQAVLTVDDDGPGIADDRLADVFEPFVRLEESRSGETGGIGLGLAIARSIVHAHGGTIALENRPEGGLRATVHLPLGA